MNLLKKINLVLLILLGGAAGLAKVTQAPPEIAFFQGIGLGAMVVVAFGILQLVSAVLLIFDSRRHIGAILLCVTFSLSVVMILMTGQVGFAAVSVIPVLMAGWVIYDTRISGS
jgi:hypothetical protein